VDVIVQQALEGQYGFKLIRRIGGVALARCGRPGPLRMSPVPLKSH
jgi:hypothetical protein